MLIPPFNLNRFLEISSLMTKSLLRITDFKYSILSLAQCFENICLRPRHSYKYDFSFLLKQTAAGAFTHMQPPLFVEQLYSK